MHPLGGRVHSWWYGNPCPSRARTLRRLPARPVRRQPKVAGHRPPGVFEIRLTLGISGGYRFDCQKCRTQFGHFLWPRGVPPRSTSPGFERSKVAKEQPRPRVPGLATIHLTLTDIGKGYTPAGWAPPITVNLAYSDARFLLEMRGAEARLPFTPRRPAPVVGSAHPTRCGVSLARPL